MNEIDVDISHHAAELWMPPTGRSPISRVTLCWDEVCPAAGTHASIAPPVADPEVRRSLAHARRPAGAFSRTARDHQIKGLQSRFLAGLLDRCSPTPREFTQQYIEVGDWPPARGSTLGCSGPGSRRTHGYATFIRSDLKPSTLVPFARRERRRWNHDTPSPRTRSRDREAVVAAQGRLGPRGQEKPPRTTWKGTFCMSCGSAPIQDSNLIEVCV